MFRVIAVVARRSLRGRRVKNLKGARGRETRDGESSVFRAPYRALYFSCACNSGWRARCSVARSVIRFQARCYVISWPWEQGWFVSWSVLSCVFSCFVGHVIGVVSRFSQVFQCWIKLSPVTLKNKYVGLNSPFWVWSFLRFVSDVTISPTSPLVAIHVFASQEWSPSMEKHLGCAWKVDWSTVCTFWRFSWTIPALDLELFHNSGKYWTIGKQRNPGSSEFFLT